MKNKKIFEEGETRKRIRLILKKDGKKIYDRTVLANIGEALKMSMDVEVFLEKHALYGEIGTYKIIFSEVGHEREESEDDQEDGLWGLKLQGTEILPV